jgi:hypothetical protein
MLIIHCPHLVLPHLSGDIITTSEFVGESISFRVEEETTDTTKRLSSQKEDLVVGAGGFVYSSYQGFFLIIFESCKEFCYTIQP